jgi:hypothetical protein
MRGSWAPQRSVADESHLDWMLRLQFPPSRDSSDSANVNGRARETFPDRLR